MKTKAAVIYEPGKPMQVEELEIREPGPGEVLMRYTHAGICHSDIHVQTGDLPARLPMVLGHEGAGIVERVGAGVTRVKAGDTVVCSYIPNCGTCKSCATGQQSMCDMGATILEGYLPGGVFPLHKDGVEYGGMCMLGSWSQYGLVHQNSCIPVDPSLPLEKAVLVGCGVPTGWGAAVNTADVRPGQVVIVYGTGGVGSNAVQGAKHAGARYVIAVDPVESKRTFALTVGATHAVGDPGAAHELVMDLTHGLGADSAILAPDTIPSGMVEQAVAVVAKGGSVILVGGGKLDAYTVQVPGANLTLFRKSIKGSLFGDCNPTYDIPRILSLYQQGAIKLDELVTRTYGLDEINMAIEDVHNGKNIRGVLVLEH